MKKATLRKPCDPEGLSTSAFPASMSTCLPALLLGPGLSTFLVQLGCILH
jgi:hypothetical protein